MDNNDFAFDRKNFIIIAICMAVVIMGFILMSGTGSTETTYNPEIFNARRTRLAPALCFIGYVAMAYAILHRPGSKEPKEKAADTTDGELKAKK